MASVVPAHMAAESGKLASKKVWQNWPGEHQFCCDGRVMVGPDFGVTVFAFLLTTVTSGTFWATMCPSLPLLCTIIGIFLYVQTVAFMWVTATMDPGIVPANRSMDEAEADACAATPKSVEINGVQVPLKWCRTCRIYRPPRAAHCSECNVCVEKFDHHCPWMGQCIGKRNYRFFLGFVNSVVALCVYTLILSGYVGYKLANQLPGPAGVPLDFMSRMGRQSPASVVLCILPGAIILCVAPLACYHCSLVANNKTTSEEIKDTFAEFNPFSGTCGQNCNEACCAVREPPALQPRALASAPLAAEEERRTLMNDAADPDGDEADEAMQGLKAVPPPGSPHDARERGLRTAMEPPPLPDDEIIEPVDPFPV